MKNLFIGLSLAAALLTTSCTTDLTNDTLLGTDGSNAAGATKTITVGIDNNATRIHTGDAENGHMPLYWSEGDVMEVNGSALRSTAVAEDFDGEITAQIEVPAEATYPMTLLYPAAASSNKADYFYIPGEQAYDATKLANGYAILMGYVAAEGDKASMQHQCGYINVALTGNATVTKVMLRAVNHESISGYFIPTFSAEGNSMKQYSELITSDGYYNNTAIVINCGEGVALGSEATNFTFALPAANYAKGFELTILDSNNKQQSVTAYANGKEVKAGVITNMPALAVNCSQDAGIYNSNAFIGFVRSVEKDLFIDNNNTLNLRADISLKGFDRSDIIQYPWLINFRGNYTVYNNDDITVFDGHNFAICDYKFTATAKASALIFGSTMETLTIQNLVIGKTAGENADSSLTVAADETSGYLYTGILADDVAGVIKNCTNNASLIITPTNANGVRGGAFTAGGSDTWITNEIVNCTNNGLINVDLTGSGCAVTGTQIGGIVSRQQGGKIDNCTNNGPINVTVKNVGTSGVSVGGIVGWGYRKKNDKGELAHVLTNCTNNAPINVVLGENEGAVNGAAYAAGIIGVGWDNYDANDINVVTFSGHKNLAKGTVNITVATGNKNVGAAGISGYTFFSISDCSNAAAISQSNVCTSTATHAGGISANFNKPLSCSISNCTNTGSITINPTSNGNNCLGGISGYTSTETDNGDEQVIIGCTNRGTLTHSGTGLVRGGGISGSSCRVENCVNYGEVKMTNTNATELQSILGGINGAQRHDTKNSHNYGNITALGCSYAAGIAGWTTGGADTRSMKSCSVDCTVTAAAGKAGIMVGELNTAALTVEDCKIYGTVKSGDVTVTGNDLFNYLYAHAADDANLHNLNTAKDDGNVTLESTKPAN